MTAIDKAELAEHEVDVSTVSILMLPDRFSVHEVFITTKSGTGSSNYTEFMVPFTKVRIMTGQCIPIVLCTLLEPSSLIGLWKW
jgi:hypothetical protein